MKKKRGVQKTDIYNLALLSKVLGVIVILIGLVFLLGIFSKEFRIVALLGLIVVLIGILFISLGIGLGRFRMWAWYLGVVVLVPLNIIGGILGLILLGFGLISLLTISMILSAFYVSWVLLSKGGRSRYRKISESLKFAEENPDSKAGRIQARRKRR